MLSKVWHQLGDVPCANQLSILSNKTDRLPLGAPQKSPNEKSPKHKLELRVVLTALRRCYGIENIALVKVVRLGLVRLG